MKNLISTLFLSITEFITDLSVKAVIFNNKGNKIPSGYTTHKIFNKIYDYYSDYVKTSSKSGLSALIEARKSLLSDIDRLTVSSYITNVSSLSDPTSAKKGRAYATKPSVSPTLNRDDLEDAFIKNHPSLKALKNLFFKLDNKPETLRFIQLVLIKIVKYAFWPLIFITIYIYIIKIMSIGALFLGAGYGYLRYSGLDLQPNDLSKYAYIVRDYVIKFWTRFINKSFNIELVNKNDLYQEAYDQARTDIFQETRTEAMEAAGEHFNHKLAIIEDKYAASIQSMYNWIKNIDSIEALNKAKGALAESTKILTTNHKSSSSYIGDGTFVLDNYVNQLSSYINSWLPNYDTVVTTTVVTTASLTALAVLAFYLHRGGTLGGHEENVKKLYQTAASLIAAKVFGSELAFEETVNTEGQTVRTFKYKLTKIIHSPNPPDVDDDSEIQTEDLTSKDSEPSGSSSAVGPNATKEQNNSTQPSNITPEAETGSGPMAEEADDDDNTTTGSTTPKALDEYFTRGNIPSTNLTKTTLKKEVLSGMKASSLANLYLEAHKAFESASTHELQHLDMKDKINFYMLRDNFNLITSAAIEKGLLYSNCKHPIFQDETIDDPCRLCNES
jgi:hypothetical protein